MFYCTHCKNTFEVDTYEVFNKLDVYLYTLTCGHQLVVPAGSLTILNTLGRGIDEETSRKENLLRRMWSGMLDVLFGEES